MRVQPSGSKTFCVIMRDPRGKQVLHTIGSTALHTIDEARELARDAIKAIKAGQDRRGHRVSMRSLTNGFDATSKPRDFAPRLS